MKDCVPELFYVRLLFWSVRGLGLGPADLDIHSALAKTPKHLMMKAAMPVGKRRWAHD